MKVTLRTQPDNVRVKVQADPSRPVSSRPFPTGTGLNWNDRVLPVEFTGQTEFNVFSLPTGRHYLMINGLEHYAPDHYTVAQVGGNVRLTWLGAHLITTSMKLIFRTF